MSTQWQKLGWMFMFAVCMNQTVDRTWKCWEAWQIHSLLVICRPIVFRGKILWLTPAELSKFRGLLRPSICAQTKLYSVKKLHFFEAGMMLSYASNIQKIINLFSFQKCNLSISHIVFIFD